MAEGAVVDVGCVGCRRTQLKGWVSRGEVGGEWANGRMGAAARRRGGGHARRCSACIGLVGRAGLLGRSRTLKEPARKGEWRVEEGAEGAAARGGAHGGRRIIDTRTIADLTAISGFRPVPASRAEN